MYTSPPSGESLLTLGAGNLERRATSDPEKCSWLYRPAPPTCTLARLFCFAYAGVGATVFRLWPSGLPSQLDVCGVQLPGRASRLNEPPLTSIKAIVEALVPAIVGFLDIPFAFFGHSMGAIVAFETARVLASRSLPSPKHLIVSGQRSPRLPDLERPLHGLDDGNFITEISRRYGGIPKEIMENSDILTLLLPCLRADILALETYRPERGSPLTCSLSAFGGADDVLAPKTYLEAWHEETNADFEVSVFPGGHFYNSD
jgi:medium-chain acyl-[acyl-carrier-protein] hydrolase